MTTKIGKAIRPRDVRVLMQLLLLPDFVRVSVLGVVGSLVSVQMPGGDIFTVPAASLRRVTTWREIGFAPEPTA